MRATCVATIAVLLASVSWVCLAQDEVPMPPVEPKFNPAPDDVKPVVEPFLAAVLNKIDAKAAAAICTTPFLTVEEETLKENVEAYLAKLLEGGQDTGLSIKAIEVSEKTLKDVWEGYPTEFAADTVCRATLKQKGEAAGAGEEWADEAILLLRKAEGKWKVSGVISLPWF